MQLSNKKEKEFYLILQVGLILSWIILIVEVCNLDFLGLKLSICFFKELFGIPCPSCGTTRALIELTKGNVCSSLLINPLALVALPLGLLLQINVIIDYIMNKDSSYRLFLYLEMKIKTKVILIFFIVLILSNWIWNIFKNN